MAAYTVNKTILFLGDAVGKQHENTATFHRLPQRAQHRHGDRGGFVLYRRSLWFPQVW